jgi:hypothetical protein
MNFQGEISQLLYQRPKNFIFSVLQGIGKRRGNLMRSALILLTGLQKGPVETPDCTARTERETDRFSFLFKSMQVKNKYRSLRRADPSSRGVIPSARACVCVLLNLMRCNNNPLHQQWVGRRDQTRKKELLQRLNTQYNKSCHNQQDCLIQWIFVNDRATRNIELGCWECNDED